MKIFFYGYNRSYATALAGKISTDEASILAAYSQVHAQTLQREDAERRKIYEEIMSRADSLSGVELAVAFEAAYQQSQEVDQKRYDALLARLSGDAERVVREFACEHVRPNMSFSNQVAVAEKAPELYKKSVLEAREDLLVEIKQPLQPSSVETQRGEVQSSAPTIKLAIKFAE